MSINSVEAFDSTVQKTNEWLRDIGKQLGDDNRIVIDCNGFRRDKDAELRQMAHYIAEKARMSGVAQEMGPLNPYERRIVHLAIAEAPDVSSESIGDAFLKTVIISTKK